MSQFIQVTGEEYLRYLPTSSPRGFTILRLCSEGYSCEDIASMLVVSKNTIKSHLTRICRKANARNRYHLISLAYETGIL